MLFGGDMISGHTVLYCYILLCCWRRSVVIVMDLALGYTMCALVHVGHNDASIDPFE